MSDVAIAVSIEAGLHQAFRSGGHQAVEDFWIDEIIGRRQVFGSMLADFQIPRLLAITRGIIAPVDDAAESHPEHIKDAGYYWIEQLSGPIYAIAINCYQSDGQDEFKEEEPHEKFIANIARAIIRATKESH